MLLEANICNQHLQTTRVDRVKKSLQLEIPFRRPYGLVKKEFYTNDFPKHYATAKTIYQRKLKLFDTDFKKFE